MNTKNLNIILDNHKKFITGESGGARANLSRANLSMADLCGADLGGADLSRAYLHLAYLGGANLSRANLSRADLSRAYLSRADLRGADLSRADLSRADLSGAYLSGADLGGAKGILSIGPIGSRGDMLYIIVHEKTLMIKTGCFWGALAEFESAIKRTHGDNQYAQAYRAALALARVALEPQASE